MSTPRGPDASKEETQKRELIDLLRRVRDGFNHEDLTFPPRTAWNVLVEILGTPEFQEFCPFLERLAQSELPPYEVIFIVLSGSIANYSHGRNQE